MKTLLMTFQLILLSVFPLQLLAQDKPLTVVELFTSQGCSSCPSADQYLGELSRVKNIVAISCHVTYWNYLGWKDSFSMEYCDQRQSFYKDSLPVRSRYTPQMVINGELEGAGSQRKKIKQLLTQAKEQPPMRIGLMYDDDELVVDFSELAVLSNLKVDLLGLGSELKVNIALGENRGRNLTYNNVIRIIKPIDLDDVRHGKIRLDPPSANELSSWVVLANNTRSGKIAGVGRLHF